MAMLSCSALSPGLTPTSVISPFLLFKSVPNTPALELPLFSAGYFTRFATPSYMGGRCISVMLSVGQQRRDECRPTAVFMLTPPPSYHSSVVFRPAHFPSVDLRISSLHLLGTIP